MDLVLFQKNFLIYKYICHTFRRAILLLLFLRRAVPSFLRHGTRGRILVHGRNRFVLLRLLTRRTVRSFGHVIVFASGHLSAWDARERVDVESVMASAGTSVRDVAEAVVEDAAVFGVPVVTVG